MLARLTRDGLGCLEVVVDLSRVFQPIELRSHRHGELFFRQVSDQLVLHCRDVLDHRLGESLATHDDVLVARGHDSTQLASSQLECFFFNRWLAAIFPNGWNLSTIARRDRFDAVLLCQLFEELFARLSRAISQTF